MALFVPATLQKRLLRHVLGKLELVDAQSLDLDRLDIAWGRLSTFSLRDVPLAVTHLAALLKLPPEIAIESAKILLLKATIPANILNTPIRIEIDGIEVRSKVTKTCTENNAEEHLPTKNDLAQSFLRDEATAEDRQKLAQAASIDPKGYRPTDTDSEEDDEDVGMGQMMPLPQFLANMLKGIQDRLEVSIKNVELRMASEHLHLHDVRTAEGLEPPQLSFLMRDMAIKGITTEDTKVNEPPLNEPSASEAQPLHDRLSHRRQITLTGVSVQLLLHEEAEHSVNLLPSDEASPPPSSTRSITPVQATSDSQSKETSSITQSVGLSGLQEPLRTGTDSQYFGNSNEDIENNSDEASDHHREDPNLAQISSIHSSDDGRFADASEEDLRSTAEAIPVEEVDIFSNALEKSDSVDETQSEDLPSRLVEELRMSHELHEAGEAESNSKPLEDDSLMHSADRYPPMDELASSYILHQNPQNRPDPDPSEEDLAQSRVFSHEEAESLYLSVHSNKSTEERPFHIPGAWSTSSVDQEEQHHTYLTMRDANAHNGSIEHDDGVATPTPGSRRGSETQFNPERSAAASHGQGTQKNPASSSELAPKTLIKMKTMFSVDQISIWLPNDLDLIAEEDSASKSTALDAREDLSIPEQPMLISQSLMAGSFSQYAEASAAKLRRDGGRVSMRRSQIRNRRQSSPPPPEPIRTIRAHGFDVEVGSVAGTIDFPTLTAFGKFAFSLQSIFGGNSPNSGSAADKPRQTEQNGNDADATVTILKHSLTVRGVILSLVRELETEIYAKHHVPMKEFEQRNRLADFLFRVELQRIGCTHSNDNISSSLSIRKFSIASSVEKILWFNKYPHSSWARDKDIREPQRNDVEIFARPIEAGNAWRVSIQTRPLEILADVTSFDRLLESVGGLSGLLELSTSFATPFADPEPPKPPSRVHFAESASLQSSPKVKLDARVAGLVLKFRGQSCGVSLETSAVRFIPRPGAVKISFQMAQLSGPDLFQGGEDEHQRSHAFRIKIQKTELIYLDIPSKGDLDKFLDMVNPSQDGFETDGHGVIMVDTLLRQRSQGALFRAGLTDVTLDVYNIEETEWTLVSLAREAAKLSTVTKYLPDDNRPGLLTLAHVANASITLSGIRRVGTVHLSAQDTFLAHVALPSLTAVEIGSLKLGLASQGGFLLGDLLLLEDTPPPMIRVRIMEEDIGPTIRVRLFNVILEYHIQTLLAVLGLSADGTPDEVVSAMAESIATLTRDLVSDDASVDQTPAGDPESRYLDLRLSNCGLGLNPPSHYTSRAIALFEAAAVQVDFGHRENLTTRVDIEQAYILLIDDVYVLQERTPIRSKSSSTQDLTSSDQMGYRFCEELTHLGFARMGETTKAEARIFVTKLEESDETRIDVVFNNRLIVLETCADSTQTLIDLLNSLAPPKPPSKAQKYRTQPISIPDLMSELEFEPSEPIMPLTGQSDLAADPLSDDFPPDSQILDEMYQTGVLDESESNFAMSGLFRSEEAMSSSPVDTNGESLLISFYQEPESTEEAIPSEPEYEKIGFIENYFGGRPVVHDRAQRWDSVRNKYGMMDAALVDKCPLKITVQDANFVWNLHDGYDWVKTRDTIKKALDETLKKAEAKRKTRRRSQIEDDDDLAVESPYLFESVWVTVPVDQAYGRDELLRKMDEEINAAEDKRSVIDDEELTSTKPAVYLARSRNKTVSIQLSGVSAQILALPPAVGETQSSVDVKIKDAEIFDHLKTSAWRKFLTYQHDAGQREYGKPMVRLELLTVKPVPDLDASELVVKVSLLPLRIHCDQDTLDFITKFFQFKNEAVLATGPPTEPPFIQRLEINKIPVKFDYKPKRVSLASIRAGRALELMNFTTIDSMDILLRRVILYGISGFDKIEPCLSDIWTPDVKRTQKRNIVSGLALVRPIANVGNAIQGLWTIPLKEYEKDGRIVRAVTKGAHAFLRNTTSEVARLGAKLAIGTQTALEGAEGLLLAPGSPRPSSSGSGTDVQQRPRRSNYANQPIGVIQGIRTAAKSLEKDLLTAKDAIIAIPGEVLDSDSATSAAAAVAKRAPTVILRPAIAVTKAVGTTLIGAGNALDPAARRKVEDKYKQ